MRVIIHTTEQINHIATIEVDLEAVNAYYKEEVGVVIDGHVPEWAIKNYLLDQRDVWLDSMQLDGGAHTTNYSHTLGEINVIS